MQDSIGPFSSSLLLMEGKEEKFFHEITLTPAIQNIYYVYHS